MCIELLEKKFAEYGLSLQKLIVGIMNDGASVMKKARRLLPVNQPDVQLAKVLYQKQDIEKQDPQFDEDEQSEEHDFSESNSYKDEDFSDNEELLDLEASHRH